MMIKPEHLKRGDRVAVVSLSRGLLGVPSLTHKYHIAKKRLEEDFGLEVVCMEHTLADPDFLAAHPEARAEDMMNAFRDRSIKGVFCAIGGDDAIRLLPYIDFGVLRDNPKVFTGFSDSTTNHFMMYKAGVCSYYGASVMCDFAEYVKINDYSREMIVKTLFEPQERLEITPSPYCCYEDSKVRWSEENVNIPLPYEPDAVGYELLQGEGTAQGELLGGCAEVFLELLGTPLWPTLDEWRGKILFLETSEVPMPDYELCWLLRNLAAQGILNVINGIIVGKPAYRADYEKYKPVYVDVLSNEVGRPELPVLYNVNFGHANPRCILPIGGVKCEIDCERRALTLLEPATR